MSRHMIVTKTIQILGRDSIVPKQANYKAVIQKIIPLKPDLLYFGGTTQSSGPQIALWRTAFKSRAPPMLG